MSMQETFDAATHDLSVYAARVSNGIQDNEIGSNDLDWLEALSGKITALVGELRIRQSGEL
jgi:hypothetical protein